MHEAQASSRPPLALVASAHEWLARSFESVLGPNGFAVLRAYTGRQALDHARDAQPDAVFLDVSLSDLQGVEICRSLRADPQLAPGTPIFLITSGPAARQERLEALRAGAWEIFAPPLDAEELLLKLGTYVSAKMGADRARDEGLLDQLTGFYNVRGLLRRVRELGSDAFRYHRALACIAFSPESAGVEAPPREDPEGMQGPPLDRLARLLKETCRASDVIGRLGQNEFIIVAPNTDPAGALNLAQRLTAAAEDDEDAGEPSISVSPVRLRAGLFAVPDFQEASIQPVEMLVRATMALRRAQAEHGADRIRTFDISGPVSLS